MIARNIAAIACILLPLVSSRSVPDNVQRFYNSVKAHKSCSKPLASGFTLSDSVSDTDNSYTYCGDRAGLIYIQGVQGKLADMDIDCDGQSTSSTGDTRCDSSTDTQSVTSFADQVQQYGIEDLNAYVHSYVVFGNSGTKSGYVNFDPQKYGMSPLSVMAVVCGNKLIYGVWGDTNGDDGARASVGESSLALGTLCYGQDMNGNNGHSEADVLYIGFRTKDAETNSSTAWDTDDANVFESSLAAIGDRLVQKLDSF